uniref:Uncharacterized protein n=1 Tax=Neobacillus citreus TaxID=2833578 RepID=A0A942SYT5_9BACI
MPPRVLPSPDAAEARRIKRSRALSYVLVLLAAVVFSLRPELFGDPQSQPAHALLHVWRIVVGVSLGVAALAVQVIVGVRWRRGLRRAAEDGPGLHGNAHPADR